MVDDHIPCGEDGVPCFAKGNPEQDEMWTLLLEKAVAKVMGRYELLVGSYDPEANKEVEESAGHMRALISAPRSHC